LSSCDLLSNGIFPSHPPCPLAQARLQIPRKIFGVNFKIIIKIFIVIKIKVFIIIIIFIFAPSEWVIPN